MIEVHGDRQVFLSDYCREDSKTIVYVTGVTQKLHEMVRRQEEENNLKPAQIGT